MKGFIHVALLLMAFYVKANSIIDVYTGKPLRYEEEQVELQRNYFNRYDKIVLTYPRLTYSTYPQQLEKLNQLLEEVCVKHVGTDSFKTEFLRHTKEIYGNLLHERQRSQDYSYGYPSLEEYQPKITQIECVFQGLFDGLLIIKIGYAFTLEPNGQEHGDPNLTAYQRCYYLSLREGKFYTWDQLFKPSLFHQFKTGLDKKLVAARPKEAPVAEKIQSTEGEEVYEEEESYEGEEWRIDTLALESKDLILDLTPFDVLLSVTDYSPYATSIQQTGMGMRYSIKEFIPYIFHSGPLKNLAQLPVPTTALRNTNSYKEQHTDWSQIPFYQEIMFDLAPKSGIHTLTFFQRVARQNKDTVTYLNRRLYFLPNGKLDKTEYFSDGQLYNTVHFTYNTQGALTKIQDQHRDGTIARLEEFSYDKNNNLVGRRRKNTDGDIHVSYQYVGNLVYERYELPLGAHNQISIHELSDDGHIIASHENHLKEPNYVSFYDKGKLMGGYSTYNPSHGSSLYCYNQAGQLLSKEEGDGRRTIYEYCYNPAGLLNQIRVMEEGMSSLKYEYRYDKNLHPSLFRYNENGYEHLYRIETKTY